jgi:hypothetical protein
MYTKTNGRIEPNFKGMPTYRCEHHGHIGVNIIELEAGQKVCAICCFDPTIPSPIGEVKEAKAS